jgi:hypothetical protein
MMVKLTVLTMSFLCEFGNSQIYERGLEINVLKINSLQIPKLTHEA